MSTRPRDHSPRLRGALVLMPLPVLAFGSGPRAVRAGGAATGAPGMTGWFAMRPRSSDSSADALVAISAGGDAVDGDDAPRLEPSPFSFSLNYALYSDYVFRGINFSEFSREGREKPNHQLTTTVSVDLGPLFGHPPTSWGTFSFSSFFEWFAAQKSLDPIHGGQNLQEVDYSLSWSYDVAPINTSLSIGYTFYTFPHFKRIDTSEWSVALDHNDAWMWRWMAPDNTDPVLSPHFVFVQDVDIANGGSWMELGLSHDFALTPDVTLTPGITFAVDHRWMDPILGTGRNGTTRLAFIQYGLTVAYDLSGAMHMPAHAGDVAVSGFIYFSDATSGAEDDGVIQDEFYGGMSIEWTF